MTKIPVEAKSYWLCYPDNKLDLFLRIIMVTSAGSINASKSHLACDSRLNVKFLGSRGRKTQLQGLSWVIQCNYGAVLLGRRARVGVVQPEWTFVGACRHRHREHSTITRYKLRNTRLYNYSWHSLSRQPPRIWLHFLSSMPTALTCGLI